MIQKCNLCDREFLTEADAYVVIPIGLKTKLNCGCYFIGIGVRNKIKNLNSRIEFLEGYMEEVKRILNL